MTDIRFQIFHPNGKILNDSGEETGKTKYPQEKLASQDADLVFIPTREKNNLIAYMTADIQGRNRKKSNVHFLARGNVDDLEFRLLWQAARIHRKGEGPFFFYLFDDRNDNKVELKDSIEKTLEANSDNIEVMARAQAKDGRTKECCYGEKLLLLNICDEFSLGLNRTTWNAVEVSLKRGQCLFINAETVREGVRMFKSFMKKGVPVYMFSYWVEKDDSEEFRSAGARKVSKAWNSLYEGSVVVRYPKGIPIGFEPDAGYRSFTDSSKQKLYESFKIMLAEHYNVEEKFSRWEERYPHEEKEIEAYERIKTEAAEEAPGISPEDLEEIDPEPGKFRKMVNKIRSSFE